MKPRRARHGRHLLRDDVGGSGLTRLDAAVIFEALSTGCPTVAAIHLDPQYVRLMIDTYGSDAQRQAWLPALVSIERCASYCLTEQARVPTPPPCLPGPYGMAIAMCSMPEAIHFRCRQRG